MVWRDQRNDNTLPRGFNSSNILIFNTDPVVLETETQTLINKTITASDNTLSLALSNLTNVTITTVADTDFLIYDN